ncbi:hypothetical protein niasHT_003658 [Heterodera trifolii]|uniref:Sodium/potassium-transporting ATPase subunit beta-1-interacting protein n=1 Tax=Heterodera trifolii TaxID=157864 RepID=A0ABD2MEY1_9BILA
MARKLHFCALIWLVLWLALSTVRQVFDIIGKLWALVLIDMFQLIAIMSGLVALCQPSLTPCRNRLLLTVLALISALSVGHNVAVLLWFCTDLLVADHRQSDLLSFGLPFGHSFFLRHTPLCEAHYNLSDTVEQAEQQQTTEHCPIQYSHLEGGQAVLHTLMALGTLLLVVALLLWNNDNDDGDRNRGYGSTRVAERSVKKYGFAEDYVTTAGAGDTVTATAKELGSVYMEPSCCFEDALSATGSAQLVASGKVLAPAPPAMAPVLGGVVRRSYPRAGRRPAAGAAVGPDGDCPQRSKRSNLKKTAHNRSTPASPSPVVPSPVGAVHERYSSLSTAGAIDAVQPYFHNNNNNTASSSSTASAYGSNTSNSNKTMASNGSGAINNYHNRNQQAPLQYAYGSRRRPSPSFYTPLAGLAAVGGAAAAPRSPCSFVGGGGDRSGIVMQQLPQHRLPYSNNYRRGGSMRTFCAVAPGADCCEPGDASAGVAGDYAVQRRQRVSFSPPACSVLSNCSSSSISQHHQNALALRRGTDGRRSAGPTVAAGDPSGNSNSRQQMASLINFGPIVQNSSQHHHITSLISFDPKSNTLIRVREHRRPSSSSSSLEEASGGDRYSLTQPATGQLAAATGDCSESVPSSPAPELSPSSCPPVGRFELLQQSASAVIGDHMKGQRHAPPLVNNGMNPNSAPPTRIANVPSSSASGRGQQKKYYYDYGGLDNSSNSYGGNGQIGPNNNNNQNNNNNCIDGHENGRTMPNNTNANVPSSIGVSMYEAYVGTAVPLDSPRTAFPALIDGSPQQRQQQQSSATARRSLLFDCSAASAIRLSSHSVNNGTSATDAATGGDCGDRSQTAATVATTAFRPRVGTTNETMLGMFV